ncbi:MAG: hypothetical protein WDZ28_02025 [Simkaniaceae bacterium]
MIKTILFSICIGSSLFATSANREFIEAKKKSLRARRYERMQKQHSENLIEIETLRKELIEQGQYLDIEIEKLQTIIETQKMKIAELSKELDQLEP